MISKKNSVLIFEPKIFLKDALTDQNLTFAFKKHEIFGRQRTFIWKHAGFFFCHAQEVKGCDIS